MKKSRVIIFTILFLISSIAITLPKTTSKYVSENSNSLLYNAKFYSLYQGVKNSEEFINLDVNISTKDYAYINVNFPYTNFDAVGLSNYYTFSITPNTCSLYSFNDILSNSNIADSILNNNTAVIKCEMNNSGLDLDIRLYETINNETTFAYMDFEYDISNDFYLEKILLKKTISKDSNIIDNINLWMMGDANNIGYTTKYNSSNPELVRNYLLTNINSEDTLVSANIKGINKVCSQTECTLDIASNFDGYAYSKANLYNKLYFSTDVEDEIEDAFLYYLGQQSYNIEDVDYTFTDEDIEDIMDYVSGKLKDVLDGNISLAGISLNNDGSISILYDIAYYAKIFKTFSIDGYYRIYWSDANVMSKSFELIVDTMSFQNDSTANIIKSEGYLVNTYLKNNETFMRMLILFDGEDNSGNYVIFLIASDGVNNNKVKTFTTGYSDNIESVLSSIKDDYVDIFGTTGTLQVIISSPYKDCVQNMIDNNMEASRKNTVYYLEPQSYTANEILYWYSALLVNIE